MCCGERQPPPAIMYIMHRLGPSKWARDEGPAMSQPSLQAAVQCIRTAGGGYVLTGTARGKSSVRPITTCRHGRWACGAFYGA